MTQENYDCGLIGLGTMGRNLAFNLCEHGFSVAGCDNDPARLQDLEREKGKFRTKGVADIRRLTAMILRPRIIIMLVPAGEAVDSVISELKLLAEPDDIIMDFGNSFYKDTNKRAEDLAKMNIHFMGVGISGGESGARFGPSLMPGGDREAYGRVTLMLEAIAAKVGEEPCVAYMGQGSAGHYVKMVHNGIEYGIMQLIAESYHLLKEVGGLKNDELHAVFSNWDLGELGSFLIRITAGIFLEKDLLTPNDLLDMILDTAHQKGTGKWVSQDALDLQLPVPAIDASVSARDLSALRKDRLDAAHNLKGPLKGLIADKTEFVKNLEHALYFSTITTYAQGFALLRQASVSYNYDLKLPDIAGIWRGGCIIRSKILEILKKEFARDADTPNVMTSPGVAGKLAKNQAGLRQIVKTGAETGIPLPAFMSSLAYYDSYRSGWLPTNLIQAQRDYFGAHTYQRTDREGTFHTHWNQTS